MSENLGSLLSQVSRLFRRCFDQRARNIGVTRPQWQVLSLLKRQQGINQGGLAELLEVEPITLGRMIDRLQEAGLVERRADPTDRRAWRLHMTGKGDDLIESLIPHADETVAQALSGFTAKEEATLIDLLACIRANLLARPAEGNGTHG